MFDKYGLLRTCKQKSKLMTTLKVEIPARSATNNADVIFLGGCVILWVVSWPDKGTVEYYLNNFRRYLLEKSKIADMFLVFDQYYDESIKGLTRKYRDDGASQVYQLTPVTALPPQDVVLKVQLIQLIVQNLVRNPAIFHGRHKLIVTGQDPVPLEIYNGYVSPPTDLRSTQEEADTILVHQVSLLGPVKAIVIVDDTDVFVLLLHSTFGPVTLKLMLLCNQRLTMPMLLTSMPLSLKMLTLLQIYLLLTQYLVVTLSVLLLESVKKTVLRVLRSQRISLASIGVLSSPFSDCMKEGTTFLLHCYGQSKFDTLTDARKRIWKNRVAKNNSTAPKLVSLPPTDATYQENLKQAHLQTAIWRNGLKESPAQVTAENFGWAKDAVSPNLIPTFIPEGFVLVPDILLKVMRCGCESEQPCKNTHCSCNKQSMSYTEFCDCEGSLSCCNPWTSKLDKVDEELSP